MKFGNFIQEITIKDPDTNNDVSVSIFKHDNGGIFGVDSSYLDETTDLDNYPIVRDVFNDDGFVILKMQ